MISTKWKISAALAMLPICATAVHAEILIGGVGALTGPNAYQGE